MHPLTQILLGLVIAWCGALIVAISLGVVSGRQRK